MSTPTSNTSVTSTTFSGMSIGLIVGVIVIAMLIIGVVVFVVKRRQSANAVPSGAPTAANGLGAMNLGSNAVPRTTMNVNAGRTTA